MDLDSNSCNKCLEMSIVYFKLYKMTRMSQRCPVLLIYFTDSYFSYCCIAAVKSEWIDVLCLLLQHGATANRIHYMCVWNSAIRISLASSL